MPSDASVARSILSRSIGGIPSGRRRWAGSRRTMAATSATSSTRGTSAQIQTARDAAGPVPGPGGAATAGLGITTRLRFEQAHPSQFRELALVGVEHELARVAEACLENRALPLAHHHDIGALGRGERGAGAEDVEEHAV